VSLTDEKIQKAGNLLAGDVIDQHKVQHDSTDPSPFVIPNHISDEASGPENEAETYDDWKRRMATAAGFAAETPISHLKFLEVVKSQWKSTQVCLKIFFYTMTQQNIAQQSNNFDDIRDIWWTTKSSVSDDEY
jgi:hypothetical protein